MTDVLKIYLGLEKVVIALDEQNDPLADDLRDAMDDVWKQLTKADLETYRGIERRPS